MSRPTENLKQQGIGNTKVKRLGVGKIRQRVNGKNDIREIQIDAK